MKINVKSKLLACLLLICMLTSLMPVGLTAYASGGTPTTVDLIGPADAWTITLTPSGGGTPVPFNGTGTVSAQAVAADSYSYTATRAGHQNLTGTVVVANGANTPIDFSTGWVPTVYTVTFAVVDDAATPAAVEGASISVNSTTLTTTAAGTATIDLPAGTYPYTVSKGGKIPVSGSLTVNADGTYSLSNIVLATDNPSTVTFTVTSDDTSVTSITNLSVAVKNSSGQTIKTLTASPYSCQLTYGEYSYSVSGDGHFTYNSTDAEKIQVDGHGNGTGTGIAVPVRIEKIKEATVTFTVYSDTSSAPLAATANMLKVMNSNGTVVSSIANKPFEYLLRQGTYTYTVTHDNGHFPYPSSSTDDNTLTVTGHDTTMAKTVTVESIKKTNLTLNWSFSDSGTPTGVEVKLYPKGNSASPITGIAGTGNSIVYSTLAQGDYTCTIVAPGYKRYEKNITVTGHENSQTHTAEVYLPTVVTIQPEPATATVTVKNSAGTAVTATSGYMYSLDAGTYTYEASADQYNAETGTFTVTYDSTSQIVPIKLSSGTVAVVYSDWTTLSNAMTKGTGSVKCKLGGNITAGTAISTAQKTIELDLNGCSITGSGTLFNVSAGSLEVSNTGAAATLSTTGTASTVTVAGGSFSTGANVTLSNSGTALTVSSGSATVAGGITGGSTTAAAVNVTNGTLTTNAGASIRSSAGNGLAVSGGTANINDGSIFGTNGLKQSGGAVTVIGGSFSASISAIDISGGTLEISAGSVGDAAMNMHGLNVSATTATTSVTVSSGTVAGGIYSIHQEATSVPTDTAVSIIGGNFSGPVYTKHNLVTYDGNTAWTGNPNLGRSVAAGNDVSPYVIKRTPNAFVLTGGASPYSFTLSASALAAAKTGSTLKFTCDTGTVELDSAALASLGTGAFALTVTRTDNAADPTQVIDLALSVGGSSVTSFGSGTVKVTLNGFTAEPKMIAHNKGDGSSEYFYPTSDSTKAKHFEYDTANGVVSLTLTSFSSLLAYSSTTTVAPTITTTSPLPNGTVGDTYSATLTATGTGTLAWAAVTALPAGLTLSNGGILSGTPTAVFNNDVRVRVTGDGGVSEAVLHMTIDDTAVAKITSGTVTTYYTTVTAAINAATAGQTVTVLKDVPNETLSIGKNITLEGNSKQTGAITVASGSPTIQNVKTASITASGGSTPTLAGDNTVTGAVTSSGATTVYISGGTYQQLSPVNSGMFAVSGGSFANPVLLSQCLRILNGTTGYYTQYVPSAAKNAVGYYTVELLVPKFTAVVPASAYYQTSSNNSLVFFTNIPNALLQAPYDYLTLSNTSDNFGLSVTGPTTATTRRLTSSDYTLTQVANLNGDNAILTLNNTFLRTRGTGNYTLYMDTMAGTASRNFSVGTAAATGDTSNIGLWLWIAGGSVLVLCAAAAFIVIKNKKKK